MTLPQHVLDFIRDHVDSIETLEIILLLHRAPDTFWRPEAIESHLGLKPGTAEKCLQKLDVSGIALQGMTRGYRYRATDAAVDRSVKALAAAYAEHRISVVNAVYSENLRRLRAFADAFKVKGDT